MASNQQNNEPEPRVEIPFFPPPGIFGPTIPGTTKLGIRTGPESERDERLVNIETQRIGGNDNWVQAGPTSNPKDFEPLYSEDKDGDGHTDVGMRVNITPDFYGLGAVAAGAAAGARGGPWGAFGGALAGGGAAVAINRMNAHYAIAFNVEPGPVIDRIQDTASDAVDWARDTAGDAVDWARDRADDVIDRLNPFDGDEPLPLPLPHPIVLPPLPPGTPGYPGPTSMRRLKEAFDRLQSLL